MSALVAGGELIDHLTVQESVAASTYTCDNC
jgi:hypothetical protein